MDFELSLEGPVLYSYFSVVLYSCYFGDHVQTHYLSFVPTLEKPIKQSSFNLFDSKQYSFTSELTRMDSSSLLDLNQSRGPTSTSPSTKPKQITVPLPLSPHINLHIQITHDGSTILAFITTTESSNAVALSPLGSFVYAMPNVRA